MIHWGTIVCTTQGSGQIDNIAVSGNNYKVNDQQTGRSKVKEYYDFGEQGEKIVSDTSVHICGNDCVRYNQADFFYYVWAITPNAWSVAAPCGAGQGGGATGVGQIFCSGTRNYNDSNNYTRNW